MNFVFQVPRIMLRLTRIIRTKHLLAPAFLLIWLAGVGAAFGQTTQFTYQGKLSDNSAPVNGSYDFVFTLWDAAANGNQIGSLVALQNTQVVNGIFTVQLDFGAAAFNGAARYLEITVKLSGNPASLPTLLTPRQLVTSTPYAIKSLGAVSADSLSVACVNCITSNQIASVNGSAVTGTIPVASVPAGSSDYIQNTISQQPSSNFNISGTGKADTIDVATQYNIGGLRILSNAGSNNLIAGTNAGSVNTGGSNAFFGTQVGQNNTTGSNNSFFGSVAGQANTTGSFNAFFGTQAGKANTSGGSNAFFGNAAGFSNTTGGGNAFFGSSAGKVNTTGSSNAFFGSQSGASNTTGQQNAFFGGGAGLFNTTGFQNAFFGASAGQSNTTGFYNSFVGYQAGVSNTTGQDNAFFGTFAGITNSTGGSNAFFGKAAGSSNTTGANNTFIGFEADFNGFNSTGNNNTLLGSNTQVNSGISNATAIGANASATQSNSLILGSINGVNGAMADAKVGIGTTAPTASLHVIAKSASATDNTARFAASSIGPNTSHIHFGATGDWVIRSAASSGNIILQDSGGNVGIGTSAPLAKLHVNGLLRLDSLGSFGTIPICGNSIGQISYCSSSRRYKTNIAGYAGGLNLLNRLRPVTFDWKDSKMRDFGFLAEEVAEVEPLLVIHNDKGEIEGVKYSQISTVLVNAIKEQQAQIEEQTRQLKAQNQTIEALKNLVCATNPTAEICKKN